MKKYPAKRKGAIHYIFVGILLLPVLILALYPQAFVAKPWMLAPLITPMFIIIWTYVDTSYAIDQGKLTYRSAFLKGEIEISKIREIIKGKTMYSGIKPALSGKGLIIRYNQYSEIYIAPENNEALITDLLSLNQSIIVKDHAAA